MIEPLIIHSIEPGEQPLTISNPLTSQNIHLWQLNCHNCSTEVIKQQIQQIAPEEKKRAESFVFEKDRNRYILSSSYLRKIISLYTGFKPLEIHFELGKYKKPQLVSTNLHFNLSHSHDIILYAFSSINEVGVDVEYMREMDSKTMADLVRQLFSPKEIDCFFQLSGIDRIQYFFSTWTKKEAYLKAMGTGLYGKPHEVEFQLTHENEKQRFGLIGDKTAPLSFSFVEYEPASKYVATTVFKL